jgi:spermidine/putrescine transport system substrate-binding protein
LSRALAIAAGLALCLGLVSCGGGASSSQGTGAERPATSASKPRTVTASVTGRPSGTLTLLVPDAAIASEVAAAFERGTGVTVKAIALASGEAANSQLASNQRGDSGGASLTVVPDWAAAAQHEGGDLQDFDRAALPTVRQNIARRIRQSVFDPGRRFTVPWRTGMTGIVVRKDLAPGVHSICDLFDPRYRGRVELPAEMRESVAMTLKCLGIQPIGASEEEWRMAIEKIAQARGQFRFGGDLASDLEDGKAVAAIVRSDQAAALVESDPGIEWRQPREGCVVWSEEMVIPVHAPNPTAAEAWIDYVYRPQVQARLVERGKGMSSVESVEGLLERSAPAAAKNRLLFPLRSETRFCSPQAAMDAGEEARLRREYAAAIGG